MKASVIIPLYNKSATIERSLASIAAQTYSDYEVIVVDDGSSDDGPGKVRAWNDRRVRLLTQANAGPGPARNLGIREAQGELLAFLDADDEWLPEYLAESVRVLNDAGPEAASVTSGYFEWPSGQSREAMWARRGLKAGVHRLTPRTSPMLAVYMLAYMSPWSTVARADVVRGLGGFFDREKCLYAEDAFLWLKVLLRHPVVFHMMPLVRFHTEASGLSKNLAGPRPVEPFLAYPEDVEHSCPEELRDLLRDILAIRAMKTACMLGYWGQWRQARSLCKRFVGWGAWHLPYFVPAAACATPLGATAGYLWRSLRARHFSHITS